MSSQQSSNNNSQSVPSIIPFDPTLIIKSESSTAVILACAILISILLRSVTGLVEVIMKGKK